MSKHPLNSAVRLLLEMTAIVSFGIWGYHQTETGIRILLAILLPMGFAVRDDQAGNLYQYRLSAQPPLVYNTVVFSYNKVKQWKR